MPERLIEKNKVMNWLIKIAEEKQFDNSFFNSDTLKKLNTHELNSLLESLQKQEIK